MDGVKILAAALFVSCVSVNVSQQTAPTPVPASTPERSTPGCEREIRSTYLLGPDDQVEISGPELTEFGNKPGRIDSEGNIQAPLVGRVHVAGMTAQQVEQALDKGLRTYIRDPQVVVNVSEIRSQPVSVVGAVNTPGVQQVQGHKTLLEMLSLAGGVRQDARYSVRITRRVEWGCIMEAKDPEENIQILPHDVITVPKAEMVYVIGEVRRSGGFVLGEHQSISVLRV